MQGYDAETYGERWAEVYDTWFNPQQNEAKTQRAVDVLAELAASTNHVSVYERPVGRRLTD